MRVLITGGGGNLGRVLAPTLEEVGHEPILMDNRTLETPHKAVRGNVRDRDSVLEVFRETDVVVHAAALHGIHLEKYTTDDFWDLNVVGTRNVYEAARELGIGKILLCSTMGVYGDGVRESGDPPVIIEDLSLQPSDFYGFSKRVWGTKGGQSIDQGKADGCRGAAPCIDARSNEQPCSDHKRRACPGRKLRTRQRCGVTHRLSVGSRADRPCEQDVDSRGSGGRNTLPPDALMGTEAWCRGHLHPELRSTPTVRFRASYL
jgi:hypothetical protein